MSPEKSATPRLLVVEDEDHLARGIAENLEAEGYCVDVAKTGTLGLAAMLDQPYALVVLDVMLPELDGFAVCQKARQAGCDVPVLFLTARGGAEDRIRGLEAGGDDYLEKPFRLREFMLRVKAILRRGQWLQRADFPQVVQFGGNEVDFRSYRARSYDGEVHQLTQKEALVLRALYERAGEVVTRDHILDRAWGYEEYPSERTVDNFLLRLRKRFERDSERPRHFHTVRGAGYRFSIEPE